MHILFCLEYFFPHVGGVEQMMFDVTRALVKEGIEVTVLTSRLPGASKEESIDGVRVVRKRCPKPLRVTFNLLILPELIKLARHADVIHCSTYNGVFPALLASRVTAIPLVGTVHEVWLHLADLSPRISWIMKRIYPPAQRFLLKKKSAMWIPVSESTRNALRLAGVPDGKIQRVYNPVDVSPPKGWTKDRREKARRSLGIGDDFSFLYFGRPGIWRGVEYLIRAFQGLLSEPLNRLVLVLSREPSEGYSLCCEMARSGPRRGEIHILDSLPRERLIETILAADAVVVPSLSEGFGLIAAEATSLGVPVIASDVTSLPEVVGGKCLFVPPADPKALRKAMEKALRGEWEQRPVRRFPLKETVRGYREIYESVLEK